MTTTPPPARGVRLEWSALPERVRAAFTAWAGSPVTHAETQPGGFSPGVAARLRLADGRRVFVKAVSGAQNPDSPHMHRDEGKVAAALPASAPVPRLLWVYDEDLDPALAGLPDRYILLAFEDVEGVPPAQPLRMDELRRVVAAMADLAAALTPSPLHPPLVRDAREVFRYAPGRGGIHGWQKLRDNAPAQLDGLDEWSRANLDLLAELESNAPAAAEGDTLLNFDTRADNILLTPERVVFVDWPHATVGADWIEIIGFAPSVAMQGGPDPETLLGMVPMGRRADPDEVNAVIATLAGFFTQRALEPPPPGLPTLRAFQAAQGVVAREWLRQRLEK